MRKHTWNNVNIAIFIQIDTLKSYPAFPYHLIFCQPHFLVINCVNPVSFRHLLDYNGKKSKASSKWSVRHGGNHKYYSQAMDHKLQKDQQEKLYMKQRKSNKSIMLAVLLLDSMCYQGC